MSAYPGPPFLPGLVFIPKTTCASPFFPFFLAKISFCKGEKAEKTKYKCSAKLNHIIN